MPRYLAMMRLEFCGQTYQQNDYLNVPHHPSAAEKAQLERLHSNRALREVPLEPPSPGADRERNAAMAPEPAERQHQRGYKTRAGGSK
jgi:hypothetical protein